MINRLKEAVQRLLAPPYCFECRIFIDVRDPLCQSCSGRIKSVVSKELIIGNNQSLVVHALGEYAPPLTSFIRAKHLGSVVPSKQLAELIFRAGILNGKEYDYIVPVPLHWTKKLYRGFNQAEELARQLSVLTGKPYVNLVVKKERTSDQAALGRGARSSNLSAAFEWNAACPHDFYQNKKIVLVDDVMTTGSTLAAVASALMSSRPSTLMAVVGARVL